MNSHVLTLLIAVCCCAFALTWFANAQNQPALQSRELQGVNQTLETFHRAAANARLDLYIKQLAPNGVFIGTDASERWTRDEFRAFCKPYFDEGRGWLYRSKQRNITFSPDKTVAWFDELLDNESYGTCRGTGTLIYMDERWQIAQYALTFPIPNDIAKSVVELIQVHDEKHAAENDETNHEESDHDK